MSNKYGITKKEAQEIIDFGKILRRMDTTEIAQFALELACDYIQDFKEMSELATPEQVRDWLYNRDEIFNSVFAKYKEGKNEQTERV